MPRNWVPGTLASVHNFQVEFTKPYEASEHEINLLDYLENTLEEAGDEKSEESNGTPKIKTDDKMFENLCENVLTSRKVKANYEVR